MANTTITSSVFTDNSFQSDVDSNIAQSVAFVSQLEIIIPSTNVGDCKIKRDKKADENKKLPGESSLAKDIREITQTILAETDCDALQLKVKTAMNGLIDDLQDKIGLTDEKLKELSPIIKIPLNPFKIPAYLVKFAISRILPDLEATIDLIKRTVEVITALNELIRVIQEVIPNLKACALDFKDDLRREIEDEIDQVVDDLRSSIAEAIAESICEGVNAAGITANDIDNILSAKEDIETLVNSVNELTKTTESAIQSSIDLIGQNQSVLQELTGVPPVLDTTSIDTFLSTVQSEEYEQYKQTVGAVLTLPDPVANAVPVITGSPIVGTTLSCSDGTWTANGVSNNAAFTYSHQWHKNGAEIYGANTSTYVPTIDDVETKLFCIVTAKTHATIEQAQSAETGFVTFALAGGNKPTITGTASSGSVLSCSTGTWPFTPTLTMYEWIRGESTVVQALSGNNLYTVTSSDIGSTIKCKVVAQSFRYTLSDTTVPTSVIIV